MKARKLCLIFPAVLMVATSMLLAMPDRDDNSRESIQLISTPQMMDLADFWAAQYNIAQVDVSIQVELLQGANMRTELLKAGTIGLVSNEQFGTLGEAIRILPMGRELIVPVINSRHPRKDLILKTGVEPLAFARDFHLVCNRRVAETYLDGFLPQGFGSGQYTLVGGTEEVLDFLSRNPGALGFCPLADFGTGEGNALETEVILVPIDANSNGSIDYLEDIWNSPADLMRAAWIGKFPRALSQSIYVATRPGALEEEEIAFLDWLAFEGQQNLALMGFSCITGEEVRSIQAKLGFVPPTDSKLRAEAEPGKVLLLTLGVLALLLLLFFIVPGLFRRWVFEEDEGIIAGQAAVLGEPSGAPGGLFFDRSHTWAFLEKDGKIRVGIDEFLQNVTGPITRVVVKKPGEKVRKGDTLLKLVQRGKQLEIKSPVSGQVVEQNRELLRDSSAINSDPYEAGWICRLEPIDWMKDLKELFRGERYDSWIRTEFMRLKKFFTTEIGAAGKEMTVPVMQDGGEIRVHVLEGKGPEVWEEFQTRFINATK